MSIFKKKSRNVTNISPGNTPNVGKIMPDTGRPKQKKTLCENPYCGHEIVVKLDALHKQSCGQNFCQCKYCKKYRSPTERWEREQKARYGSV